MSVQRVLEEKRSVHINHGIFAATYDNSSKDIPYNYIVWQIDVFALSSDKKKLDSLRFYVR
jgi:hypothetical protein